MSKTTLRKRIALTATTALFAGMLTVATAPVASASHPTAGTAVAAASDAGNGTVNASMFTTTEASTTTTAAVPTAAAGTAGTQKGLLSKDSTSGTAQTATILAGGQVAFYAEVTTAAAFTATGGSFDSAELLVGTGETVAYNSSNTTALITFAGATSPATIVATRWTAPTTLGTYTVSLLTGYYTNSSGVLVQPSLTTSLPTTLSAAILVTVVAASAGGTYSATRSACKVETAGGTLTYSSSSPATDTTTVFENGTSAYIQYDLNDTYQADLPTGNITVTSTNGALVNASTATSLVAGTNTTAILSSDGT